MPVPDLPGCVADGESIEAAIAEAHDAFQAWAAAEFLRVQVPAVQGPGGLLGASSQAGEEFVAAIEERRRNLLPLEEREPFDDGPAAQVANIGINAHAVYRAPLLSPVPLATLSFTDALRDASTHPLSTAMPDFVRQSRNFAKVVY